MDTQDQDAADPPRLAQEDRSLRSPEVMDPDDLHAVQRLPAVIELPVSRNVKAVQENGRFSLRFLGLPRWDNLRNSRLMQRLFGLSPNPLKPLLRQHELLNPSDNLLQADAVISWPTFASFAQTITKSTLDRASLVIGCRMVQTPEGEFVGLFLKLRRPDGQIYYLRMGRGAAKPEASKGVPRIVQRWLNEWLHHHPQDITISLYNPYDLDYYEPQIKATCPTLLELVKEWVRWWWGKGFHAEPRHQELAFVNECKMTLSWLAERYDAHPASDALVKQGPPKPRPLPTVELWGYDGLRFVFNADYPIPLHVLRVRSSERLVLFRASTRSTMHGGQMHFIWNDHEVDWHVFVYFDPATWRYFEFDEGSDRYQVARYYVSCCKLAAGKLLSEAAVSEVFPQSLADWAEYRACRWETGLSMKQVVDLLQDLMKLVRGSRIRGHGPGGASEGDAVFEAAFYCMCVPQLRSFTLPERVEKV